ncbi:MAG: c-type cytochrome [Burkholderiales bacterium]
MSIAIVLILLVVGSVLFHIFSPWWFTPIASNWQSMDDTVGLTFWVTGFVFVAVNLFMAYAVVRYRHRKGNRAKYEPENKKLEWWLTILTTVGVAAMLTPGLFVWAKFVNVPQDASVVEAVGQQWNWSYRLPGKDGVLGTTSAKLVSRDNSFGIDPNDPNGRDDVLIFSPELHLPIGKPVKLLLRSKDVLHDFTVPQFRVKMDLVPGIVTHLWFTPTKTGAYDVLCEELCGIAHFAMRGRVVVDEDSAFQSWLARQPTFAQTSAQPPGDVAAGQAAFAICSACHGAKGEGNAAIHAPKLAGQASWYLAQQMENFKQGIRGARDDDEFGKQMAPMAATLDARALSNVLAYLATLPDVPAPATVAGNADRGKSIYATCAECHGAAGEGIWSTHAPRLAHMSDWYLARQLQNFRHGIRGGHLQDFNGAQMVFMAKTVAHDPATDDVLAYINTLK